MSAPELRERGLDPAHILSVANQAISGVRGSAARAVATADSVRVCPPSRRAAADAAAALTRLGYQVARIDGTGGRDVRVTGWSAAGLESRLDALRTVLHQLDASPANTAAAVIQQVRQHPASSPALQDAEALAAASAQLRAWVFSRSGIHALHDPAILPADLGNTLRLRAAWRLESAVDGLVERHVQVAERALRLFRSLRQYGTDDQAGRTAVHRAGLTTGSTFPAPGSVRRAARTPGQSPRFFRPAPGADGPGRAARPSSRPGGSTRPGGRSFPAGRPGPRR